MPCAKGKILPSEECADTDYEYSEKSPGLLAMAQEKPIHSQ